MRIVLVHPNDHSGSAEIAGSSPPAWVAYRAGCLKNAGYTDLIVIDAILRGEGMTMHRPMVKLPAANAAMACGGGTLPQSVRSPARQ